jgi:hypothetical protein
VALYRQELLKTLVRDQVLDALGEPLALGNVQVRPLWDGRYRVNGVVGADAVSAKILHSYFVVADDDGRVLSASPTIHKLYSSCQEK